MLFTLWTHDARETSVETVLPDGCTDLLIIDEPGQDRQLRLTRLDACPRRVPIQAGSLITGLRMRPGVVIDSRAVDHLAPDMDSVVDFVASEANADPHVLELIDGLNAPTVTVSQIARQDGVSVRTLQRRFQQIGLPGPDYWRLLSRARRAASAFQSTHSLAEIAAASGFSDQSHMTREFVRWFGLTPVQLRKSAERLSDLTQPGLGNWALEQISIRKPLGSRT